jgi:hypothetical protein
VCEDLHKSKIVGICWGYVTLGKIQKDARGQMTKGFFSNRIAKVTTDATTSKGGTQPIQPVNIIGSSLRQCVKSRNPGDSWPLDPTDPTCVQTSQPCQFFVKSSRSGAVIAPPCRAISGNQKKESAWVHHSRSDWLHEGNQASMAVSDCSGYKGKQTMRWALLQNNLYQCLIAWRQHVCAWVE